MPLRQVECRARHGGLPERATLRGPVAARVEVPDLALRPLAGAVQARARVGGEASPDHHDASPPEDAQGLLPPPGVARGDGVSFQARLEQWRLQRQGPADAAFLHELLPALPVGDTDAPRLHVVHEDPPRQPLAAVEDGDRLAGRELQRRPPGPGHGGALAVHEVLCELSAGCAPGARPAQAHGAEGGVVLLHEGRPPTAPSYQA